MAAAVVWTPWEALVEDDHGNQYSALLHQLTHIAIARAKYSSIKREIARKESTIAAAKWKRHLGNKQRWKKASFLLSIGL
mmetsp:Transcript_13910/g.24966  ORF Transcript_13910/g.24966 Transcript_13910/m.24966 type:complete len:80 (-) Transcript_13910:45-284(-)